MKSSTMGFSGLMQRWALGILLGLSISVSALPELAVAKSTSAEKSATNKKSDKKTVKKKAKSKKTAKSASKKKSSAKTASKSNKLKSSRKTASKSRSRKSAKTARKSAKGKSQQKAQYVWVNSTEPGQGYYIMPTAFGSAAQPAQEGYKPQPVALQADNRRLPAEKAAVGAEVYQVGNASYYGKAFHGKKTASGERFDQNGYTCAHGSLPFGCRLRVTNLRNNKSVEVKVNDRGGFQQHGRVIDLSKAAAKDIGMLGSGTAKVQIEVLE